MRRSTHRITGLVLTEHEFSVPLDHARPDGERIAIFAREAVAPGKVDAELPWLLYLQGGPGFGATRPNTDGPAWIERALRDYRLLLLDQRGTGLSTPLTVETLARFPTPEAQAQYLRHFRADSIVRDAELVRHELLGDEPWSVLGQSFGGFCAVTYLSLAPEGLREAIITGGLPPLDRGADDVYRATYRRVTVQNQRYYDRYPEDVERVRAIVDRLAADDVRLPAGDRLTPRRFRQRGMAFGAKTGFEDVHYLLEEALVDGELGYSFLRELEHSLPFDSNPIYSLLHEPCYCQGEAPRWSAERILGEFPAFDLGTDGPVFFTGEMVYPWMFEEYGHLRPLQAAAELLAEWEEWPPLYDLRVLRRNAVPVVASVYDEDMYVERGFSLETAETIGARVWVTNEHGHDGLRTSGEAVLDRLLRMLRGEL